MANNSTRSVLYGLLFGVTPGILVGLLGLAIGGEWAWTLGFIGLWLILIGLFVGPLLGSVGPEIMEERPAVSGGVVGSIPGLVLAALQIGDNFWIGVLAMVVGAILGAWVGHWISLRPSRQIDAPWL